MKDRIRNVVVLCFLFAGIIILSYCIFVEKEVSFLLPIGMLCGAIGNLIHGIFIYKRNKQK